MAALAPRELKDAVHRSYEKVKEAWSGAMKKGTRDISPEGASTL